MEYVNETKKRRKRRCVIIVCVLLLLVCIVGWWLYMETHFSGKTLKDITTDEEKILSEMPELALTQAEMDLADTVYDIPAVREAMQRSEITEIPLESVAGYMTAVIPEDAGQIDISVTSGHNVDIELWFSDSRLILEYIDTDADGRVDIIRKTIGVLDGSEDTRAAKIIYTMEYAVASNQALYEKSAMKHDWFSFLDMP